MCHAAHAWMRLSAARMLCAVFVVAGLGIAATPGRAETAAADAAAESESAATAAAADAGSTTTDAAAASFTATHRQTAIIRANVDGQPQVSVTCFCLTPDDRIVAGCTGPSAELRVFDAEGNYIETWPAPVKPDAIFVCTDGRILVAGEGQLVRLTPGGEVELQKEAPHTAAVNANPDKIREEVIQQAKQQHEQFAQRLGVFDQMIERADAELAKFERQIAALEEAEQRAAQDSGEQSAAGGEQPPRPIRPAMNKDFFKQRVAMLERSKEQYETLKAQQADAKAPPAELSDEQIDERVKSSIAYKLKASSVGATGDEVFLATRALAGYGYEIWRMDREFENGASIVSQLRGCCGQMDVKANEHGLFVAENSRHRVCRYDREGKLLGTWGHSARQGIEGFGSCCNPMNVAFGPDDAVYTAEDSTGRIKRYSVDGELLGLVGSVDLVPGCKNVSIAVSADGSRVYMLDITRRHIVRLDSRPAEEVIGQASDSAAGDIAGAIARGLAKLLEGGRDD